MPRYIKSHHIASHDYATLHIDPYNSSLLTKMIHGTAHFYSFQSANYSMNLSLFEEADQVDSHLTSCKEACQPAYELAHELSS